MARATGALTQLVTLFITFSGPAFAQQPSCGCSPYPVEGVYGDSNKVQVTYVDGTDKKCPTQLKIVGLDELGMNAILTCNGIDWKGERYTEIGKLRYTLTALPQTRSVFDQATGLANVANDTATTVSIEIAVPSALLALNKRDRNFSIPNATLLGPGRAPLCICSQVKDELDFVTEVHRLYSQQSYLDVAVNNNLRGDLNSSEWWMDDARKLHPFPGKAKGTLTYKKAVKGLYNEDVTVVGGNFQATAGSQAVATASARRAGSGSILPSAFAQTNPTTCIPQYPTAAQVIAKCLPSIMIEAAVRHEENHASMCRSLNEPSTYTAADGTDLNWITDQNSLYRVWHNGREMPRSGYSAWSDNVSNLSKDETASYQIEIDLLSDFFTKNCLFGP